MKVVAKRKHRAEVEPVLKEAMPAQQVASHLRKRADGDNQESIAAEELARGWRSAADFLPS